MGNLSNLESLYLSDNRLTGEIPAELGNLSSLNFLLLGRNRLAGCIPNAVRRLLPNLERTDVSYLPECTGTEIIHSVDEEPQIYNGNVFALPVSEDLTNLESLRESDYAARFFEYFGDEFDFLIFVSNLDRFAEPSYTTLNWYVGCEEQRKGHR